jgi:ssDNA-binding Zn-finger/Zn-ribbon topoisomerase 1
MIQQNFPTFSILDHLDRLNIVKETSSELHCTCPLCDENGFKVHKKTGKYGGFKCDCMDTPEGKKAVIERQTLFGSIGQQQIVLRALVFLKPPA